VPGYLATSFSEAVACVFLYSKFAEGKTAVKWMVEMEARGRDDGVFKCKQVNFVDTNALRRVGVELDDTREEIMRKRVS
jgi:hypothetical protein